MERRSSRRAQSGAWSTGVGLFALAMVFAGCDSGALKRQVSEIHERNAANERECIPLAVRKVRDQWLVRDGRWYGKLDDGSLVRLDSPELSTTAVKKGRPYCCRWLGEIAISAKSWRTEPAVATDLPFSLTYTVLVQDSKRIEVVEVSGPDVEPPSPDEIGALAAAQ